jgi:hypothetical protein
VPAVHGTREADGIAEITRRFGLEDAVRQAIGDGARERMGPVSLRRQLRLGMTAASDVEALKGELGGLDPRTVFKFRALPGQELLPQMSEWSVTPSVSLLDIACGAGCSDCVRFLLEFCGLEVSTKTMRFALASENDEMIRDVWNRLSEAQREAGLVSYARVAAEFHNMIAFVWLLGFADEVQVDEVAHFVVALQLASPFVALASAGFDYARLSPETTRALGGGDFDPYARNARQERLDRVGSMAKGLHRVIAYGFRERDVTPWNAVLDATSFARLDSWTTAVFIADAERRVGLAEKAPASRDFVRLALVIAAERHSDQGALERVRERLLRHVLVHGSGNRAWMPLLNELGLKNGRESRKVARALLAAGASESELGVGDELSTAAWLFPGRLRELVATGADVRNSAALH